MVFAVNGSQVVFELIGCINHQGYSISTGHYTVDKIMNDALFRCDDDFISKTTTFDGKNAYLLLLKRVEEPRLSRKRQK